ncbi:MAG: hypothetical protein LBU37_15290 [Tannerellaceae bacterium]|jgi:hypothetical protein|nr:hypothetical protein [Tannerellaceae bacterium]
MIDGRKYSNLFELYMQDDPFGNDSHTIRGAGNTCTGRYMLLLGYSLPSLLRVCFKFSVITISLICASFSVSDL